MRLAARIAAARTTIPTSLIAISCVFRSDSPLLPQFRRAQRLRLRRARRLPDEQGARGPHSISAAYTQDQHSILAACTQGPHSISAAYAPSMHAYRRTIGVTILACVSFCTYYRREIRTRYGCRGGLSCTPPSSRRRTTRSITRTMGVGIIIIRV